MFQVLIVLGCICIGMGFYGRKSGNNCKDILPIKNIQDNEDEIKEIKERIDLMERILFQDMGTFKEELENQIVDYFSEEEMDDLYEDELPKEIVHEEESQNKEQIQINKKYLDQYKKLCEYENKEYTLDQISSALDMQKGELLLLKNLFKNISE